MLSGKAENAPAAGYLWDWRPYLGKKDPIKAQVAEGGEPYVCTPIFVLKAIYEPARGHVEMPRFR